MSAKRNDSESNNAVLVVDDDHAVRLLISTTLQRRGYTVTLAKNGRVGVEHVRAAPKRFSLIMIDYQMPEMDGVTASRAIRQFAPDASVVLMSSETLPSDLEDTGVREFLAKPFVSTDLNELLDRYLES